MTRDERIRALTTAVQLGGAPSDVCGFHRRQAAEILAPAGVQLVGGGEQRAP